jgi:hypothetical protein
MKKILAGLATCALLMGIISVANATYIDFASTDFSGANGQSSYTTTSQGIDITIEAYNTYWFSQGWGTTNDTISWNPGPSGGVDGIGVNDDEISNNGGLQSSEYLYISFTSELHVDSVDLTDLFYEDGYFERGSYWLETSTGWETQQFFIQDNSSAVNGAFTLSLDRDVVGLWFAGINNQPQHDYSIRGIQTTVPEPATLLLFGAGLAGLVGYSRKRSAQKS